MTKHKEYINSGLHTLLSHYPDIKSAINAYETNSLSKQGTLALMNIAEANLWYKSIDKLTNKGIVEYTQRILYPSCIEVDIVHSCLHLTLATSQCWGSAGNLVDRYSHILCSSLDGFVYIKPSASLVDAFEYYTKGIPNLYLDLNTIPKESSKLLTSYLARGTIFSADNIAFSAHVGFCIVSALTRKKPSLFAFIVQISVPLSYVKQGVWSESRHAFVADSQADALANGLLKIVAPNIMKRGVNFNDGLMQSKLYNPDIIHLESQNGYSVFVPQWQPTFEKVCLRDGELYANYASAPFPHPPMSLTEYDMNILKSSLRQTRIGYHIPYFSPIVAFRNR